MVSNLREVPIVRRVLPWTGKLDGDDSGYRDVKVAECQQRLVVANDRVQCMPVYAIGAQPRLTPFYKGGIGAPKTVLLRDVAVRKLERANELLLPYRRAIVVLDGMRLAWVQADLWKSVFTRFAPTVDTLSLTDWVTLGNKADDTASFCKLVRDDRFERAFEETMRTEGLKEMALACEMTSEAFAESAVIFKGNYFRRRFTLDKKSTTAHGNGSAFDIVMIDLDTGLPVNMGVPFDSTDMAAVMDFFEFAPLSLYQERVAGDSAIQQYLREFGIETVTQEVFDEIQGERRLLFGVMNDESVNASFFSLGKVIGESWHYQVGDEENAEFAGAGSGCHSILKNIRDPANGDYVAIFGNEFAHQQAATEFGMDEAA